MIFTNLTRASMYMQCCHREVPPGGNFIVPWYSVKENRAVRCAMNNGALAWESEEGEPEVPGSPVLPSKAERAKQERKRRAARKAAEAESNKRREAKMKSDDEAVKANMARMGNFDVPQVKPRRKADSVAKREKPITREDVIADDKPKSLADIVRHNRAVKAFGGDRQEERTNGGKETK